MLGMFIHITMIFRLQKYRARFYLEPRSLLIFTDRHYSDHLHGIDACTEDIITADDINNVSLTDIKFLEDY